MRNMYSLNWQSATEAIEQWSSGAVVPAVLASLEGSSQPRDTSVVHALYCLSNSAAKGKSIPFSPNKLHFAASFQCTLAVLPGVQT